MKKSKETCEKQLELPVRKEQYRSTLSVSETETHEIVQKKTTAEKTCRTSQTCLTAFFEKRIEHIEYELTHESAGHIAEPETNNQKPGAGKEKTAANENEEQMAREKLLKSVPRCKEKCRRMQDIPELTCKETVEALLRLEKTPEKTAAYLNCSIRLVYRAMKELHIPTARAYAPEHLEHKLNLKKIEGERKK